jgi:pimeloyl-ACP methyl ester carboxylesterase
MIELDAVEPARASKGTLTVVLLPGNMCNAPLWAGDDDRLQDVLHARGLSVVRADLFRHDSVPAMAAAVLAAFPGPLLPLGFSMGGIVALEMARQAPRRLAGMILADTNAGADLPERAAARPGQQARVRAGALATIVADELSPLYFAAINRNDAALNAVVLAMAMDLGPDVFCRQSEALRTRGDGGPAAAAFPRPLLLLVGAEDVLCPPAWHQALALRIQRPTLAIVTGAGHMLPLEQPAAFAASIADWIDDHLEELTTWR